MNGLSPKGDSLFYIEWKLYRYKQRKGFSQTRKYDKLVSKDRRGVKCYTTLKTEL